MNSTDERTAVVLERRFDAPAKLVWLMWTDPEHFAAWYGPGGASIPVVRMDVRVGGTRHLAMEMATPNGPIRMWFTGEYREVVPHERLVYTEAMSDEHGNVLLPEAAGLPPGHPTVTEVQVAFAEHNGVTTLTLSHAGIPGDSPAAAGWATALDKLASHLLVTTTVDH
jgi:uncharacterized protein YndB with AHSA1/START domain